MSAQTRLETPPGYRVQTAETLPWLLAERPTRDVLGGAPEAWRIEEVGDGNLNLVFIVRGPDAALAVKQALPYVRLVGESWPLPLSRAHYEHMALRAQARLAPGLVPAVLHYDADLALIAMEYLAPHIIMRQGMIEGTIYPRFAQDIATFMAGTLFGTSALAQSADAMKAAMADFAGNTALCKITEDLIFSEPYMVASNNRWTAPWLDGYAAAVRTDADLRRAVSRLKLKFMGAPEAMIHGDLHTGSVMLTPQDTRVIDPEFSFMGPMGFDVGALIANLLLNYFSQIGHEASPGARDAYRLWILETIDATWRLFRQKFLDLWRAQPTGDGFAAAMFADPLGALALEAEREAYMDRLFEDALGFAGAKMIRRILGLAHNIDLEWIADEKRRATAEARALTLARDLMVNTDRYRTIGAVTAAAARTNALSPDFG
ncbi:MAG: S-methyl-5-thioribose kinase [Pseudomonadota bacterium]